MLRSALGGLAILLAANCHGAPAGREAPAPLATVAAAVARGALGHTTGSETAFRASLAPERIEAKAKGAAMTASLEVSAPPSFHTVRWVVGVYRPDGTAVDTQRSANVAISGGTAEQTIAWPELPDGYYVARATVVGTDGAQDGSSVTELFLGVHDGDIDLLDTNDWLIRSGAIDARPSTI